MKIMIVTIPLRDDPSYGIPYGALAIMNYVRKRGYDDLELFHIDIDRPAYEDALDKIVAAKPDILGISAIVSTSYEYTKRLSLDIKKKLPDTLIVVGGNMAASAEILLRKTGTDLCVIGEGEKSFLNVVQRSETTHNPGEFADITGLALVDRDGNFINTGYETALPAKDIWDIDLTDLEKATDINNVFHKVFVDDVPVYEWVAKDPRSYEPHRRNKTFGQIACVKGCVARCTFCHRWDKGVRHVPVDNIMRELDLYIENYNLGFVMIFAETFGNDKRWLKEFCEEIKKRDVLWWSGGLRANAAASTQEWIANMHDAGASCLTYGNETGSEKMLQIMEKKVKIEDNYNSMKWTIEAGIHTGIQLVLGMPGENNETIQETIEYCKYVTTLSSDKNPNDISCNSAQALPGTPLYEYGRHKGLIGQDIDAEEAYLLSISDRNARDESTTLNFTDESTLICRTWRPRLTIEVNYNYVKTFGVSQYYTVLAGNRDFINLVDAHTGTSATELRSGAYIPPSLIRLILSQRFGFAMMCYPVFFYHVRSFLPLMVLINTMRRDGTSSALDLLREFVKHKIRDFFKTDKFLHGYKSLRQIVSKDLGTLPADSLEMKPFRDGR
jgi:anaerobic magnesium-protoporphyrin IX monomethyl ester cyclase